MVYIIKIVAGNPIIFNADAASEFKTTAGDLSLESTAGSVIINAGEAVPDAIRLLTFNETGGIDIDVGRVTLDGIVPAVQGTSSFDIFTVTGADGAFRNSTASNAGDGGGVIFTGGAGGEIATGGTGTGGTGADLIFTAGTGGNAVTGATRGTGGNIIFTAGATGTGAGGGGADGIIDVVSQIQLQFGSPAVDRILRSDATGLASWVDPGVGGLGDVIGPGGATDDAIVRFNGTSGKSIKNSGIILDNSDAMTGILSATMGTLITSTAITGNATGQILLDTSQVAANAIRLNASVGGIDIDAASTDSISIDAGQLLLSSKLNTADAIRLLTNVGTAETIILHNTLGNTTDAINIDADAGGIAIDAATGISLDAGASSNLTTSSGTMTVSGPAFAITGSSGIGDIDTTSTLSINSSGGVINMGNDAISQAINIGTGAAARIITMGNITGATTLNINSGTGGIIMTPTGVGIVDVVSQLQIQGGSPAVDRLLRSDGSGLATWVSPAGLDTDAIHDNVAGEILAITLKGTPTDADLLIIEDIADSNNKKRVTIGTLPFPQGSGTNNHVVKWNGTTDIQDSGVIIDGSDNITGILGLTATGAIDFNTVPTFDVVATNNTATALQIIATGGTTSELHIENTTGTSSDSIRIESTAGGISLSASSEGIRVIGSEGLRFEETGVGTDYIGLYAPAVVTTSVELILPDGAGVSGNVLSSSGANPSALSWQRNEVGTGVISGGLLTINADDTLFDISDGNGIINNPTTGANTYISWTGLTGQSTTYTGLSTYVSIDSSSSVVYSSVTPSESSTRDNIFLGILYHGNATNITTILDAQETLLNSVNQIRDLMEALGYINVSGNVMSSNSLLTIAKTTGEIMRHGINFTNDIKNPHIATSSAFDSNVADTFRYIYQDGSIGTASITDIITDEYDDGNGSGSPGNVPNNRYTVQRIYILPDIIRIQPGQFLYRSIEDAKAAIVTEAFVTNVDIAEIGMLTAYLAVKGNANDLSDLDEAEFIGVGKFPSTVSGGAAGGNVIGPATSTDNALVRWDDTSGTYIQDSLAILDDLGDLSGLIGLEVSGANNTLIESTLNALSIYLHANGGVSESIRIHSDQGTGNSSINIESDVGGIRILAGTILDIDSIGNLTIDAAGTSTMGFGSVNGTGDINIGTSGASRLVTVGSITSAATTVLRSGTGNLMLTSTGTGGAAISLNASSGGIDIISADAVADAIHLHATNAIGGITLECGSTGIEIKSQVGIRLYDDDESNYTQIESSSLSANWIFTLPVDDGTNLQVLQTDGSGNTSWVAQNTAPTGVAGGDLNGTYPNPLVDDGADSTAIHDNTSGEILAITAKGTPIDADLLIIEDSAASNVKKRVTIGTLPFPQGSGTNGNLVRWVASNDLQDSGIAVDGSDNVTGILSLTATGAIDFNTVPTFDLVATNNTATAIQIVASSTNGGIQIGAGATGDINLNSGALLMSSTGTRNGPGAIGLDDIVVEITTTGTGNALTLADGTNGQLLKLVYIAENAATDTAILTPTSFTGGNTILFVNLGESANLIYKAGSWYFTGGTAMLDTSGDPNSTGVISGGILTVNGGDDTKFDISNGVGSIYNPTTLTTMSVSWSGLTAQSTTYSGILTYVSLNSLGVPQYSTTKLTNTIIRDEIFLGVLVHVNGINIDVINDEQMTLLNPTNQIRDLSEGLGFINVSGNLCSAGATDLTIQKTEGGMFKFGANFKNDIKNPHVVTLPALNTTSGPGFPDQFQYRMQDGTGSALTLVDIDPNNYDDGSAFPGAAVPGGDWTIQQIYTFTSNNLKIQPGQTIYNNRNTALRNVGLGLFTVEPSIAENGMLIGYLVIQEGTTDLTVTGDAVFIKAGKLGGVSSGATGGDVVGPGTSTDNRIAVWNGTTGDLLRESTTITEVAGTLTGIVGLTATGSIDFNTVPTFDLVATNNTVTALQIFATGGTTSELHVENTTGTSEDSIRIGSTAGGIDIDAAATKDIDISGGQVLISSKDNVNGAIHLLTLVGAAETIRIDNVLGTGTNAIELLADAGGIDIIADLNDTAAILIDATVGGITLDAGGGQGVSVIASGGLRIQEPGGGNHVQIVTPALGADWTFTLPPAVGSVQSVLTDIAGDGVATWVVRAGIDTDAIHDNVAAEINAITEKVTPISADLLIIEDSADSNNKKRVQIGNLPGGGGGGSVTRNYEANDFLNSTQSTWQVTTLAPAITDNILNMLTIRAFDGAGTTQEGIGFQFYVPSGAVNIDFNLVWHKSTTATGTVKFDIYARNFTNGLDLTATSWSSAQNLINADPSDGDDIVNTSSSKTVIAQLGLVADELAYFQLVRDPNNDTYTADANVISLSCSTDSV